MRVPVVWLVAIALAVAGIIGVVLVSSDETVPSPDDRPVRAAVLFPGPVRFFEVFEDYLGEAADEHDIELVFFDAGWSPSTQSDQLAGALATDVDVVAIAAVDNLALEPAVRIATEADIPLITFTNGIGDDPEGAIDGILGHVGRNEVRSGELLAEQIRQLGFDDARIASIEGSPGTTPQRLRNRGLISSLATEGGGTVVAEVPIDDWRSDGVERQTEVLLSREVEIDVIATQWADAAVVVADVLERRGRDDVAVVTLEFTEEVRDRMVRGLISSTALSSIKQEAELTAQMVAEATGPSPQEGLGFFEVDQVLIVGPDEAEVAVPEW